MTHISVVNGGETSHLAVSQNEARLISSRVDEPQVETNPEPEQMIIQGFPAVVETPEPFGSQS
jgi:hypothetical protein